MVADLHLHSRVSDGSDRPYEVICRAATLGFSAVSLTDHDSLAGLKEGEAACRELGLKWIPGVELTTQYDGHEVHLLGYGIDESNESFLRRLYELQLARRQRVYRIVEKLNRLGVSITSDQVFQRVTGTSAGRPHIAMALVEEGFCQSYDEAFERYLHYRGPAWVPKPRIDFQEGIRMIHAAGGIAILAHPGLLAKESLVPRLIEEGVDGIECFHSKHTEQQTQRYLALAEEQGLLITGGSDCHGQAQGRPTLGQVRLPWEYFQQLEEALARRRSQHSTA